MSCTAHDGMTGPRHLGLLLSGWLMVAVMFGLWRRICRQRATSCACKTGAGKQAQQASGYAKWHC